LRDARLGEVNTVYTAGEVEQKGVQAAELAVLVQLCQRSKRAEAERHLAVRHAPLMLEGAVGRLMKGWQIRQLLEELARALSTHAVTDLLGCEGTAARVDPPEHVELHVVRRLGLDDV